MHSILWTETYPLVRWSEEGGGRGERALPVVKNMGFLPGTRAKF